MKLAKKARIKTLETEINSYLSAGYAQFHSPAHCGLANPRDLSEVPGLDDLQNPKGILLDYQKSCAELFGAQESFFSVNGASLALQAACIALKLYLERENDSRPVLVARNIHKSVLSGIILAGLKTIWLEPNWDEELGIYTRIEQSSIDKLDGQYSALIITNPSYEGFYSKLEKQNLPIIVDEAHGAHYHFSEQLAKPALAYGADLVIQSWHKTLGSLTQTGVLHLAKASRIPAEFVRAAVKLLQTTSPSYLLLESICRTLDDYKERGQVIVENTIAKAKLLNQYKVENDDPLRYLIKVPGYSGEALDDYLFAKKISSEEVLENSVLAFINPGNSDSDINSLKKALEEIRTIQEDHKVRIEKPKLNKSAFSAREAFFKKQEINIEAPCPPGIVESYPGAKA